MLKISNRINKFFINKKNNFFLVTFFLFYVLSFSAIFYTNSYSSQAENEFLSEQISICATQNTTTNSVNYNYQLINEESEDASASGLSNNISLVYNISRQSTATFFYTGRVIFDGSKKIFNFTDFENNYPTILLSNVFSNHKNPNGETVHDIFELKLMYSSANTDFVDSFDNFCYITIKQADYLLDKYGYISYDDLINKSLMVVLNDKQVLKWKIANIIIEGGDDEYYQSLYGDYVLAYYHTNFYSNYSISYDLASSINDNIRFATTLNNLFSKEDYLCEVNTFNFIDKNAYLNVSTLLDNFSINEVESYLFIFLSFLFLALVFAVSSVIFLYFNKNNYLILICSSIFGFAISYFIFWLLNVISSIFLIYFSDIAIIINFCSLLLYLLVMIFIYKSKHLSKKAKINYEEFNC